MHGFSGNACLHCKKKKRKCSLDFPCARCIKDGVECVEQKVKPRGKRIKSPSLQTVNQNETNKTVTYDPGTLHNQERRCSSNLSSSSSSDSVSSTEEVSSSSVSPVFSDLVPSSSSSSNTSQIFNLFDFSGVFNNPIPNPERNHSFIKEFSTEESLMIFLNEEIPIEPTQETKKTLSLIPKSYSKLKNHFIKQSLLPLYFVIFSSVFISGGIQFLEPQRIGVQKNSNFRPRKLDESLKEFNLSKATDLNFILLQLNSYKDSPSEFLIYLSWCCLSCRHPVLFTKEFCGSPQKASIMFLEEGIRHLKNFTSISEISLAITYAIPIFFCYGDKSKGLVLLYKLYEIAVKADFDKTTGDNCIEFVLDPVNMYIRKLNWVNLLCLSTFASYPCLGNELDNMEMLEESEWNIFFDIKVIGKFQGAFNITTYTQICFLVRRALNFSNCNDVTKIGEKLSVATILNRDFIVWLESIPLESKLFSSLAEFIVSVKKIALDWRLVINNAKVYMWWIFGIIKTHFSSIKYNKYYKFLLNSGTSPIKATSMDIILCGIRALSSILSVFPPEETISEFKTNYNGGKRFSFGPEVIFYYSTILKEVTLMSLSALDLCEGWAAINEIREEVLKFHLKSVFLTVLKSFNTPYSTECLQSVEIKVNNYLGILEINNLYITHSSN
ncbi:hypothetical protein HK099_000565 [Clydaea vesicula]|uniref:Zn(2)-C6 fungal-type domain-containing protein n=1 Tax=Clydaea vesicula TaxID=447962 RepID=A0AAD5U4D6_9FUNG|nr:hypothetical protein HK099_000565 [Clydaea vesicula]